ncbi:MAG: T-complex protein 1 subunit gamma, partial [Olpidium bornovanus]
MIELSRTQDEEVGDGTTSVIILAGEVLTAALPHLERKIHPIVIISAFKKALDDAIRVVEKISKPVDVNNPEEMIELVKSSIGTKFVSRWSDLMCKLALDAVKCVAVDVDGRREVDIKRYARVEKIPGGEIEESRVLDGVMINKDVTHPKMRRRIENPRIVLLDCPLEYKKGESQTNIEVTKESDWSRLLEIEEEQIRQLCDQIASVKPDLVITEKGVSGTRASLVSLFIGSGREWWIWSCLEDILKLRVCFIHSPLVAHLLDLAQHFLLKNNITALRRARKTDNNRIARACGATIVNRVDDLKESDVGTKCGLFSVEKIADEECKDPKACTIMLRGPSKDVLNEVERNLQDAMCVARNVYFSPQLVPGGGATEMAVGVELAEKSKSVEGVEQWPYRSVAEAMEVIPRTLIQNCGGNPIKVLTNLR